MVRAQIVSIFLKMITIYHHTPNQFPTLTLVTAWRVAVREEMT